MTESLAAPVTEALWRLRRGTGVSLAFGGVIDGGGELRLRHFAGSTVGALNGVAVDVGHGLGGKVVALGRPLVVDDYLRTPRITHRYNTIIAAEGLRAMAAVPVIVDAKPIAVLYGALHTDHRLGERTLDRLAAEARTLEQQIVASRASLAAESSTPDTAELRARITEAYARLRSLAHSVGDTTVAAELASVSDLLRHGPSPIAASIELTRREQDVLSLVALGNTNARVAAELGIGVHTVKGYMKDIMRKLGAASRLEAVVIARRSGLLP
ncbi:MAG: LuxR C-terminal-related transcriptional regulator [Gordonia sp. (in: high G+C Gram-positive bacteria)]